jgi:glycosyltransferase involved in cell wall biosynthesis
MLLDKEIKKIIIHPPQEFSQSSYIITGICEFCKENKIELEYSKDLNPKTGRLIFIDHELLKSTRSSFPKLICVDVILNNSKKIRIGFDLYDLASHFSLYALEHCDFIFKRNYENQYIKQLSNLHQMKIHSLELTFRVYHKLKINKDIFLSSLLQNIKANLKYDRNIFNRLINTCKNLNNQVESIKNQRIISQYEEYERGTENTILFQTRVFPNENSLDTQQIHADRNRIIKLLRKDFPDQFKGGFIPSALAKEKYGDALTNVPSEPTEYLKAVKASKIVIYTRGLANSPAWKMAEYLSQGKVIIAERLTAELPQPLKHGKEVLFFDTDDELVNQIKLVLDDPELQERLSNNARRYFEEHVHPVKTIERIFSFTLQHA